jgi:hypothetical protein
MKKLKDFIGFVNETSIHGGTKEGLSITRTK